jgi:hypothetical protein
MDCIKDYQMKPEDKAAIKAAGITLLVAGAAAALVANPVAWGAALLGSYRMGKLARKHTKDRQQDKDLGADQDLFI